MRISRKKLKATAILSLSAVALLLFSSAPSTASGQITLEPLRNKHLKQDKKGAPRLVEQVDFMQTLVDSIMGYIQVQTNPKKGGFQMQS